MNARKNFLTLGGLALVALSSWAAMTACSDNTTPAAGNDASSDTSSSSSGSSSGGGSGSSSGSGSGSSSGGGSGGSSGVSSTDDGGDAASSSGGEAGPCASDGSTCSCTTTPDMDPYNACSSFVTNCIPFDETRVPTHPTL